MSGADPIILERMRPTWVDIDVDVWRSNLRATRDRLPAGTDLVPVLKADGYGHGAVELARAAHAEGVRLIAVALLEEALEIRFAVPALDVLVFGPLDSQDTALAIEANLVLGITGPERLAIAIESMRRSGKSPRIHLKLDSGMNRMGVTPDELPQVIELLKSNDRLSLVGLYTHYATADDPEHPAFEMQRQRFAQMRSVLADAGITPPVVHSANSAATWRGAFEPGDLVRAGLLLLGAEVTVTPGSRLQPVLRWRTAIARLKTIAAGESVGYDHTWRAERESRIATLPVGYADGFSRQLSNRGAVLIGGRRAPVVGRVSMDLVTVDVTDLPSAALGDEVVLLGRQGDDEISAEEIARLTGTIPYEVFCAISSRVPRIWREGNQRRLGSRFSGYFTTDTSD